ncbi:hypothetical protein ACP70R_003237 [Stipagrostis hirtigluma subsp. patula]
MQHINKMDAETGSSLRKRRQLSIDTTRSGAAASRGAPSPLSPSARLLHDLCVVVLFGSETPIDHAALRAGLTTTLLRHASPLLQHPVTDGFDDGVPRWVRTTVNLDDHIVVPTSLDPGAVAANPDKVVEDYVASLSTLPMDTARPLWDIHVLGFPTSEAAATVAVRVHHSLGDGASLLSLLFASGRSAANPETPPRMPAPGRRRSGPVYARPRPPQSAGAPAFAMWVWSYVALAWNTAVDVLGFVATILFLRDPHTLFKPADRGEARPGRRLVHRGLSLDDVKYIKNTLDCTVNDVMVGLTSAALSRYYFRKTGETKRNKYICVRSVIPVNLRSNPGIQTLTDMMDSSKEEGVEWGVRLGHMIIQFYIALYDNPLEYIRRAKMTLDRKKCSLEVIFTRAVAEMMVKVFGEQVAGVVFGRLLNHTSLIFSNLMGPVEKIQLFGHPVVFIASSTVGTPEALTATYQSYNNTVRVTLAVDDTLIPDSHLLLDDFYESLKAIRDAASKA